MTISPADMVLFAAVVREGSFTAAARQLLITKQTASERLGKLEDRLGVRLLERTTRRLRLTDAGAGYYERCASIAAQIEEANREVQSGQAEPVGMLRVSSPVLYGRRFLTPVVARYLGQYPRVRAEITLADRRVNLVEDGFDLAIRVGALDDSSLMVRKLGEGYVYYVASPQFARAHGLLARRLTAQRARSLRCVGTRAPETWEFGSSRVKIDPVLVVNDLEVSCEAAVAGVGIARLPSIVCREAVAAGRLCVLTGAPAMPRPVHAVYASRHLVPAKVRAFLDLLVALVEPMMPLEPTAPRRS